ncbi:glycosyltransferase family A protein [Cohnella herbarum]|uniref:Glycosyltransferase n=1 Tax=Cohnella herbarum TaxID=2728023 RepID=A0A7Z2VLC5_9BACL|nr:glycosyltransferase family A protein [Cohnella herbarum]QJD85213.1 glycosyltransferase [Cohnella herbarum]
MLSSTPQFSIILPTRNRSFIVEKAIQSVIYQTCEDWELIIVDNDVDNKTYEVVQSYISDKIKYIRTGNLPMHENWERGLQVATGNYITVLQDKAHYSPQAFEVIDSIIKQSKQASIFVWGYAFNEESFPPQVDSINTFEFTTSEIIQLFLNEDLNSINPILPKMIFSCCHRSILKYTNEIHQDFFQPLSPDYTSMFTQLSYFDRLIFIDTQLIHFNDQFSSGKNFAQKKFNTIDTEDFIALTLNGRFETCFQKSGVKLNTAYNSLLSDFNDVKTKYSGNLGPFQVNNIHVYKDAINQIYELKNCGVNMDSERLQLEKELNKVPGFIRQLVIQYEAQVQLKYQKPQFEFTTAFIIEMLHCLLSFDQKIAIWGAGDTTRFVLSYLQENKRIQFIVDSDTSKQNQTLMDIPVRAPRLLKEHAVDIVFVSTLKWQNEVKEEIQAMNLGCKILTPSNIKDFIKI